MAKSSKTEKQRSWAEAQRRCRLSDEALRMAKELGLNPRTLINDIPSPTQRWKAPVEDWVRDLRRRRVGGTPRHGKTTNPHDPANASGQPQAAAAGTGLAATRTLMIHRIQSIPGVAATPTDDLHQRSLSPWE